MNRIGTGEIRSTRIWWLFSLFSIEVIANTLGWLPSSLEFNRFALCDPGANLTVQYLISHGLRPTIDFGYAYGLLPLALGKVWFTLFGATPFAFQSLIVACGIAIAFALALIATRLEFRGLGIALLAIALIFIVQAMYPSLSQAIEQVLLTFAVAQHAAGRRSSALAVDTAAILAKPSMGYLYGFVLTALILVSLVRSRATLSEWIRAFVPAMAVGIALAAVLGVAYGPLALVRTLFPVEGMKNYQSMHYGFFSGVGSGFWDLGGRPFLLYLLQVTAFWLVATAALLTAAPVAARIIYKGWRNREVSLQTRRAEILVTCAVLHLAFITLLFGNQWSWIYYAYLLVIGVSAMAEMWPNGRRAGIALCALGLVTVTARVWSMYHHWATAQRYASTAGLWATQAQAAEWDKVLRISHGRSSVILDITGAAELMVPGFAPPTTLYLLPGLMQPSEVDRKLAQLEVAGVVMVPYGIVSACRGVPDNPRLRNALSDFHVEWKGKYYEVFSRNSGAGVAPIPQARRTPDTQPRPRVEPCTARRY